MEYLAGILCESTCRPCNRPRRSRYVLFACYLLDPIANRIRLVDLSVGRPPRTSGSVRITYNLLICVTIDWNTEFPLDHIQGFVSIADMRISEGSLLNDE